MSFWNEVGIFGIILMVIILIISIYFCIVTATLIATAIGAVGGNWWIVAITLFCSLGGTTGGALIRIGKD